MKKLIAAVLMAVSFSVQAGPCEDVADTVTAMLDARYGGTSKQALWGGVQATQQKAAWPLWAKFLDDVYALPAKPAGIKREIQEAELQYDVLQYCYKILGAA